MLAFDVEIDGKRWLLAGAENWNLLMLQLVASRYLSPEEITVGVQATFEADKSGVNNARRASSPNLSLGSKINVTLVDTDQVDEPIRLYRYDEHVQDNPFTPEEDDLAEREEWLRLKAKFQPEE